MSFDQLKRYVSLSVIILVNLIFVYKYTGRIVAYPELLVLFMTAFYIFTWSIMNKITISARMFGYILRGLLAAFLLLSVVAFKLIPVETLNVDRWSVITSFWDNFFKSEYVYYAKSHMGNPPGPMPFYFIMALPFYLLGELGYLPIIGLMVFMLITIKKAPDTNTKLWVLLFLLSSFFILWEVITRSPLFLNATLIVLLIIWFQTVDKSRWSYLLVINAAAAGFLLSTRIVFIIPYIIVFLHAIMAKSITLRMFIPYGVIAFIAFTLTYLPFSVNYISDFLVANPFIIQSTFLIPFYYTVGFVGIAFILSYVCKNNNDVFFYSGLSLFVAITIYFVYHVVKVGVHTAYIESVVDVSYFIFCTPFFLYYIVGTKTKPFIANSSASR